VPLLPLLAQGQVLEHELAVWLQTESIPGSDLSFALFEHEQAYIKAEILDELC
jgi:hypothetical protein